MKKIPSSLCSVLVALVLVQEVHGVTLTNPVVFVTQPPIPREINSTVSNTFLSVVTLFGNQQADTAHAARGGDLWLMTTNAGLVNLTRRASFGATGMQAGVGIDVRDPAMHWSGGKVLFSMVVGAPTSSSDNTTYYWQMYELTNLAAVVANTNTVPIIVAVPNQPTNCNNVSPTYATDGRIIFTSDRPFGGQSWLYPQLDEYKGAPSVSGTYGLDPATGDLRLIEHLPSGGFNPFIDSFGRLILTRWDHLIQDPNASDDRLNKTTNGSLDFLSEAQNALTQSSNLIETFPEPDDFDTNYSATLGVNPNGFNLFLPWALDQNGGNEEVLNHVGRHELVSNITKSFTTDTNLVTFTNYLMRAAQGINSANTNYLTSFLQITEDPRTNGLYWGVDAQDISIFGGAHAAGQIITLTGGMGLNPTGMVVSYITPKAGANGPNSVGLYRNPLPMSDGTLVAAFTPTSTQTNYGWDMNVGNASAPLSMYHFRLMTLAPSGALWTTSQFLTPGLTNVAIYYDGTTLVTNAGPLWELQPVEVHARPVPAPVATPVDPIEAQVFSDENVDLPIFQADLAARGLALVVSRNVTARDAADRQQPYNLSIPGGPSTIANSGKVYSITHLQYLQGDYLRGYTYGTPNIQPGRRVLATPLHDSTAFNYVSSQSNAPAGGTELMSDGSQATILPAGRAITWQLTGTNHNDSVVKERYWITFRPGEVRTCANCHGINQVDQIGRPKPTNPPEALRQLLRLWRTNAANAYTLTVNHGAGGGNFGAGSILALSAGPAPSGQLFSQWTGAGISNAAAAATFFVMPPNNTAVTAVFTNMPAPVIANVHVLGGGGGGGSVVINSTAYASQPWVLQSCTNLVNWINVATNPADAFGSLQFTNSAGAGSQQYFRVKSP